VRILHVLHTSLPNTSGYSIRANYIIRCQQDLGMESQVVTSAQHLGSDTPIEVIEDRQYWRTPKQPPRKTGPRELMLMHALKNTIEKAVAEYQPDVVHAASPVLVGLPALRVARKHKLPFVYEVRDLWENASVDRGKWGYDSLPYRGAKALETIVFKRADGIVAICEALRNEIAPRVGKTVNLAVVPNGVESELFQPSPPCQRVIDKWGFEGKRLLGYIGAFQPYEGLESLIQAMPQIAAKVPDAHLMITGGGNDLEPVLRELVRSKGLDSLVTFTGRVPHSEVQDMYSVVDMMVYPRISTRTTELTTPLKPLEAMALEVPVALSNTQAMLELVQPGVTGFSFRAGDPQDLAETCVEALQDKERCREMAVNARSYVEQKRHWPTLVKSYRDIYEAAIERNRSRH
jgi:PEP-CTERM/exosortase A-associated glycosyltransferase